MEKRWLFSLFCLLLVHSIAGQPEDVVTQTKVVHALPGTDVTLVCSFLKPHTTYVIQTQWSKRDDTHLTRIAVYHPIYGIHYFTFPEASYNFSVSFSTRKCCDWDAKEALCSPEANATSECNQWALHLTNITISLSGQYECIFATYPYGTKAAKIQLIVKAEVAMIKEEQHYMKEVQFNQTLEIPCLEDTSSENFSNYPLKWLVEENGRKEELVSKKPSCPAVYRNSSATYGQRVSLGLNNTLKIFPTKITDDGKFFSCHVLYHPERVQKSSTIVRVFTYPKISISLQEGSASTSKSNVSCIVRKAFPKPSLMWYMDRVSLTEQPGEISVEQEDLQDNEGFYQLRSTLMLQGTHQTYKTFSCVCQFSFLGNETRIISSEEIFVSFDAKSNKASSEAFTTMASEGNLSFSITDQPASVTRGKDFFTTSSQFNSTGSMRNTESRHFPWPMVIAILLLFCSVLIVLGIRKWCQYQKEIMNRPPSFKPPPPPIKYSSMVEYDGTPPTCHELENL